MSQLGESLTGRFGFATVLPRCCGCEDRVPAGEIGGREVAVRLGILGLHV